MPSRKYLSYKFFYDDDFGRTSIKRQRSYLNADGTEDTPITPLFLARLVNFDEKITGTSQGTRHVLAYVGNRILIALVPYHPGDLGLTAHVAEILAQPTVICGDYNGERLLKNGSTNSF
jgi:hypothetical protein